MSILPFLPFSESIGAIDLWRGRARLWDVVDGPWYVTDALRPGRVMALWWRLDSVVVTGCMDMRLDRRAHAVTKGTAVGFSPFNPPGSRCSADDEPDEAARTAPMAHIEIRIHADVGNYWNY